ncbi:hypothetical protein D9M73_199870 [compost metagenome]
MSGVINTVIDSWAFPGSIAFSRVKARFEGCTSAGASAVFSNQQLSGRRVRSRRHAGSICFHILHRLSARSRGVTLQKSPASRAFPTCNSDFCSARSDFSCVRGSSNTTQGVSRHACHQFHSGSGSDHVDRRCGDGGFSSPETTGGAGLHRRRFHHWPAHPAIRPDP